MGLDAEAVALARDNAPWGPSVHDTFLGGAGRQFPETTWSMVVRVQGAEGEDRQRGLETLCRRYWKPIYAYVRSRWRKDNDDAKDLTQAFFTWLVEGDVLARYAPEKGAFRHYLKGLLRNFVSNHEQALRRLKRGGAARAVPLDDELTALADLLPDPKSETPEEAFDRAWVAQLVQEATDRLRERLLADGHELRLRVFEAYELGPPGDQPTYAAVAERLGVKTSDVRNHLFAARERLRAEVRAVVADTVSDPAQLREEWSALFGE